MFKPYNDGKYMVSDDGTVVSLHHGKGWRKKPMTLTKRKDRYGYVAYSIGGKNVYAHQLVMKLYGPDRPSDDHEIDHIDGVRDNNNINNLQWLVHYDNIRKAVHTRDATVRSLANPSYGKWFPSGEAARRAGVRISELRSGKRKQSGGYILC